MNKRMGTLLLISLVIAISTVSFTATPEPLDNSNLTAGEFLQDAPSFSPDGRSILYSSREDGGEYFDIWIMNCDGSEHRQLTYDEYNQTQPKLTPDGTKILFLAEFDVWIMDAEGENKTLLTNDTHSYYYFSISPDGEKVIYVSDAREGITRDIWMMDIDGTSHEMLFNNSDYSFARYPSVTEDGAFLLFELVTMTGGYQNTSQAFRGDIFVLDIVKDEVTSLTNDFPSQDCPAYSPDEKSVLYIEHNEAEDEYVFFLHNLNTNHKGQLFISSTYAHSLSFSPDGGKIVYVEDGNIWLHELEELGQDGSEVRGISWPTYLVVPVALAIVLAILFLCYLKKRNHRQKK